MTRDLVHLSETTEKITFFAHTLSKLECAESLLVLKLGYLNHRRPSLSYLEQNVTLSTHSLTRSVTGPQIK